MSVTFRVPYSTRPDRFGSYTHSAILNLGISSVGLNSRRTRPLKAVIDSGAGRCLFHAQFAEFLGVRLEDGVAELVKGIGGPETIWLHRVTLHVPGGPVRIIAGFMRDLPVAGLLGMNGFFEHFNVTFDPGTKECVLERVYVA